MPRTSDPETQKRILELSNQGLAAPLIAEKLKIHSRTVDRYRMKAGLTVAKRVSTESERLEAKMLLVDGCSYDEVARTIGRAASTVAAWFPGFQRTPKQMGEASRMGRQMNRIERLTLAEKV